MQNISIRNKLLFSFGIILAMMVALTVLSVTRVNSTRDNLAQINDVNSVKQRHAINFRGSVHDRAIAIRDVVLVTNAADRNEQLALIDSLAAAYAENEVSLNALLADTVLSTDTEREIADRIAQIQAATNPLVDEIIALTQAGNVVRAEALLLSQASPLFSDWLAVINEFIDLQEASNQQIGAIVTDSVEAFSLTAILSLVAAMAIASMGAIFTTMSITGPLRKLQVAITQLATGEAQVDPALTERRDELGHLARNVSELNHVLEQANAQTAEREAEAQRTSDAVSKLGAGLQSLAAGRLTLQIDGNFGDALDEIRHDFNTSISQLRETIASVEATTTTVDHHVGSLYEATGQLSQRTENQAAALEETSAAVKELVSNVHTATQNAQDVERLVAQAREDAKTSGKVASDAVGSMSKIESSSQKIDTIISVIEDISFQTNLLALNAGVEAARAGEAGRGFAVVASEVRGLAQRSSEAALEIKTLIGESTRQVSEGVSQVRNMGEELQKIVDSVNDVSIRVSELTDNAETQATTIGEIDVSISQLDSVTQENAAMVESALSACQSLMDGAQDLTAQMANFDTGTRQDLDHAEPRMAG